MHWTEQVVEQGGVRRVLLHKDTKLNQRVEKIWGQVRPASSREKQGRIMAVSQILGKGAGDPVRGNDRHLVATLRREPAHHTAQPDARVAFGRNRVRARVLHLHGALEHLRNIDPRQGARVDSCGSRCLALAETAPSAS